MKHVNVSLFVPHRGCPHTCIFCNQKTISGQTKPLKTQDIISACETARACPHDIKNSEIAFFGGSFTAIDEDEMIQCLETAFPYIGRDFGGIRISTRPDCIDGRKLGILKKYGVTAIELGAQSMCESVLCINERGHSPSDTVRASSMIKEAGFSLGLQMMTGLPGSDREKDIFTAEEFILLKPDTVRIYPTVVLEGTALCGMYKKGLYTPPTLEDSISLCAQLKSMFDAADIRVIRLGLHSGGNVEEGFVAGVYHPAFGELVEGEIFRRRIYEKIKDRPAGAYTVYVNPADISKATGQKKRNLAFFESEGYDIKIKSKTDASFNENEDNAICI